MSLDRAALAQANAQVRWIHPLPWSSPNSYLDMQCIEYTARAESARRGAIIPPSQWLAAASAYYEKLDRNRDLL